MFGELFRPNGGISKTVIVGKEYRAEGHEIWGGGVSTFMNINT